MPFKVMWLVKSAHFLVGIGSTDLKKMGVVYHRPLIISIEDFMIQLILVSSQVMKPEFAVS